MLEFLGDADLLTKVTLVFACAGAFFAFLGIGLVLSGCMGTLVERIAFRLALFNLAAALLGLGLRILNALGG